MVFRRATFANQREAALALLEGGADPRLRGRFVPYGRRRQLLLSTTISIIVTMIALEKSVNRAKCHAACVELWRYYHLNN